MAESQKHKDRGHGFFRVIQTHLSSEYSGRLLAIALCELGRQEPTSFAYFISETMPGIVTKDLLHRIRKGEAQFEREWSHVQKRRADLAVLMDGKPILLMEIKEADVAASGNPAQLDDYIAFIRNRSNPVEFVHLSRYPPLNAQLTLSHESARGRVHDIRYRNLFETLRKHEQNQLKKGRLVPMTRMIREYLEDIGVDTYRTVELATDRRALTFLVAQMANFGDGGTGFGRLQGDGTLKFGLELLNRMLGNANVFADWLHESNFSNKQPRPGRRFYVHPEYKRETLERLLNGGDKTVIPKGPCEARLYVSTNRKITVPKKPGIWMYITFGHFVSIEQGDKNLANTAAYAEIFWRGGRSDAESADWHENFPSEEEAKAELRGLLKKVKSKALGKLSGDLHAGLQLFNIPDG